MDVVTWGRDCPTNSNKHTLQLDLKRSTASVLVIQNIWIQIEPPEPLRAQDER
jgi:hypothetical protein